MSEMYTRKALEIALELNDAVYSCISYQTLGEIEMFKGNFNQSEEYARKAMETAVKYDFPAGKENSYFLLSYLSLARHDFRNHLPYYIKADSIEKAIISEHTREYSKEMEAKYEAEKNKLEIERQQHIISRQNMQRALLAAGIAIFAIILVLLWYTLRLRNRRNRALSERNDALTEMNATKDKFFSIISHDLRNPAIAQRNALQLLVQNGNRWDIDKLTSYYSDLLKSADGQVELLFNLLGWAQVQTGRMTYTPETFVLTDALADIAFVRKTAENKGVGFSVQLPDNAIVTGDRNMLAIVIRNLLINAVKFTPAGGQVMFEVSPGCRGAAQGYTIAVSDTGIGMTEEQTGKLFRLDSSRSRKGTAGEQGSGLGLIVCRELLEKHGSELHIESEEGKGSRFWFELRSE